MCEFFYIIVTCDITAATVWWWPWRETELEQYLRVPTLHTYTCRLHFTYTLYILHLYFIPTHFICTLYMLDLSLPKSMKYWRALDLRFPAKSYSTPSFYISKGVGLGGKRVLISCHERIQTTFISACVKTWLVDVSIVN